MAETLAANTSPMKLRASDGFQGCGLNSPGQRDITLLNRSWVAHLEEYSRVIGTKFKLIDDLVGKVR